MLLSYDELVQCVGHGMVRNVEQSQINAASIDVRLDELILVEEVHGTGIVELGKRDSLTMRKVKLPYLLKPNEFILAATMEEFWLPDTIAAQFQLKSSGARIGLEHLKAGWCDPGWHGSKLTLELKNMNNHHPILLRAGDRIGQLAFFRCAAVPVAASYATRGHYNNDQSVQGAKPAEHK